MNVLLRPFRPGDESDLAQQANNPKIFANVRDVFPHPYTLDDARAWIAHCQSLPEPTPTLAITHDDRVIGAIGVVQQTDVHRINAEIGYWLGESYWGQGIATDALRQMTAYAFSRFPLLHRLYAGVFAFNAPSRRVLEKAGFELEAIHREAVLKNGLIEDEYLYVLRRK